MKHNYKRVPILVILFFTGLQFSYAQETKDLTLDETIQLGLQNSKQLKISHAKVDEATAVMHEMRNNMLPDIKATGAYMRINNPTVDLKVKLNGNSSSTDTASKTSSAIKVNEAAYGIVNASLPLFSGLRIHYGVESAKFLEKASKLDAENDRQSVIENAISAYNNLYKAQKAVDLVNDNLKQEKQRVSDFSNLEQNGLMARNDLLKAQLAQSNVELTLLDAQNNLNITIVNMDLMLGLPEGTILHANTADLSYPSEAGTLNDWEIQALQNRKDLAAIDFRKKAALSNIKATKGEYYPSIALTGGYIAADIPGLLTITNAINGGVGLSYNFGALYKTGAKVAQAKAQMHELEANQEMMVDQVHVQINQAYQNFLLTQKKIDVYNKAIEQANENYKITKNKYDNSLATTTDLLDADVAQLQSKLNLAYAKGDALVAYKKLQQTAGLLNYDNHLTK